MKIYYNKRGVIVRDSIKEDISALKNIRKSDVDEVWVSHRRTPEEALKTSMEKSLLCLTALINGIPVCMFGITPDSILGQKAMIWFLAVEEISRFELLKHSKRFIRYFLEYYPVLYNYIDDRSKQSIRWLKWCGASMNGTQPYGVDGLPFHYFEFHG